MWRNISGQTSCVRNHLKNAHEAMWLQIVILQELKGWRDAGCLNSNHQNREPFSLTGFYERLLKWIAVDDQVCMYLKTNLSSADFAANGQSINVIESPELRDLLLHIGTQLDDKHIPHRTKLSEMITERFKVEHAAMVQDICVSFIFQHPSYSLMFY